MSKLSIYEQAVKNGCSFECTCVSITARKWDMLMKGARKANKKKVAQIAILAGIVSEQEGKREIKEPYYNPYTHYVTKTHIIYVHSGIEHFIRIC